MSSLIPPVVARGIERTYGDRRVLRGVDLTVPAGSRTGLIGENGVGKSTLLRILAGVETPDAGTVTSPARTGILWQEAPVDDTATVGQLLDAYTSEVRAIEAEVGEAAGALGDDPASQQRYADALDAAERAEVWTMDARRAEVLAGLGVGGFDGGGFDTRATQPAEVRVAELSGGQRSRVALAGLLLGRPDALVLDEPTNHLDDDAVAYLVDALRRWPGPVVFASHDRAFLDEVATEIVDIDPAQAETATRYGGTFSDYLVEKQRERERWEQRHRADQDELARLRTVAATTAREIAPGRAARDGDGFIHAFKGARVQSAVSRRVKDAERRRAALEETATRKPPPVLRFAGIPRGFSVVDDAAVLVDAVDVRVPGRLDLPRLTIAARDRILITGPNGAGKSTLLAALAGELDASGVTRRKGLRVGMLRQDVRFADPSRTARQVYADAVGSRAETVALTDLGLLPGRALDTPVGALSVGQQRRLALATVLAHPPHLLLLDEPSNHLSLTLAQELEDALVDYPGAVVIASHDRWLRRRWRGRSVRLGVS